MLCDYSVGHVVQNMRDALSFAWNECLSCESKNMKHFLLWARIIARTSSIKNFTSSKIVRHDYFASFNQSNHCFLGLTSIFLKLPIFAAWPLFRSFGLKKTPAMQATGMLTRKCHGYRGQQQQHFCAF